MSLATVIPLLVALAAAFFGGIVYVFQKVVDRKNTLTELRRKTYQEFTDALLDTADLGTAESLSQFNKCCARLVIVGSDDVNKKVTRWKQYMIDTSPGRTQARDMEISKRLMADFVISMRRDCFERTNLTADQVYEILPIQD